MVAQRNIDEQGIQDYFNRFKSIESVQNRSEQLDNLCKAIDSFLPRIKNSIETGIDLSPNEKEALKGLSDKYSALLKELYDEFQQFPF